VYILVDKSYFVSLMTFFSKLCIIFFLWLKSNLKYTIDWYIYINSVNWYSNALSSFSEKMIYYKLYEK